MKIERSNLIESLVWYYINSLVLKKNISKDELDNLANEVSFFLLHDGSNEIPTKSDILICINDTNEIDYLIVKNNKVNFNLSYWSSL
jgi:hypothetical protein